MWTKAIVFRVEHATRKNEYHNLLCCGPYHNNSSGTGRSIFYEVPHNEYDQPAPYAEGFSMRGHHFCAFASLEHLHAWFSDEALKILESWGYVIRKYLATVWCGMKQVFLDGNKDIIRLGEYPIREEDTQLCLPFAA